VRMSPTFDTSPDAEGGSDTKTNLAGASQPSLRFRESWDPYEVWSTRVRGMPVRAHIAVALPTVREHRPIARSMIRPPEVVRPRRVSRLAVVWSAFVLAIVLGLNRELVGIFRVDLLATLLGVMTPAARVAHAILGMSALYCAIKTVTRRRALTRNCARPGN
jgi:uncharacterized membrane protein YuzA (DUF378 family)